MLDVYFNTAKQLKKKKKSINREIGIINIGNSFMFNETEINGVVTIKTELKFCGKL